MRVIHTVAGIAERYGGPSRTVTGLCSAIGRLGVKVDLVAGVDRSRADRLIRPEEGSVNLHLVDSRSMGRLRYFPEFSGALRRLLNGQDAPALIHDHGIWNHSNVAAWRTARERNVPYVLSPRGMLEPWALQLKAGKKKMAWMLYQRRIVAAASALVATSEQECENIKRLFPGLPVAVIPNGVDLAAVADVAPAGVGIRGTRSALFLSRIHQKKGLLNLVEAWGRIKPANWRIVIAGPDEGGHLAEVMALARATGIADLVDYVGEVDGPRKAEIYASADLFVLPTFSENFGVVVAEALAHGLPVITTRGAPWADLVAHRCGWWVDIGIEPLERALREAISLSDDERREMGRRGRQYVQRYDWNAIALQMAEVYRWVLGQRPRPECVRTG